MKNKTLLSAMLMLSTALIIATPSSSVFANDSDSLARLSVKMLTQMTFSGLLPVGNDKKVAYKALPAAANLVQGNQVSEAQVEEINEAHANLLSIFSQQAEKATGEQANTSAEFIEIMRRQNDVRAKALAILQIASAQSFARK